MTRCPDTVAVHAEEAARLRAELPGPIVFTHGEFDVLHAGHEAWLEAARALGGSLVVGLHGDASGRRLRHGAVRPRNSAADRARALGALAPVSAVVVFDEDKPLALLCALRPAFFVKGGDHCFEQLCEAALMQEWRGRTVIVPDVTPVPAPVPRTATAHGNPSSERPRDEPTHPPPRHPGRTAQHPAAAGSARGR